MRIALAAAAVVAAIFLSSRPSQAYEGPWCALTDIGGGVMHKNCSVRTFEMCVQEVIAGNRGFCNPNPRWQGPRRGAGRPGPGESASIIDGRRRTPVNESAAAEIVRGWVQCRQ